MTKETGKRNPSTLCSIKYQDPDFENSEFRDLSGWNNAKRVDYSEETKNSSVITNGLVKKENKDSYEGKNQHVSPLFTW